jgi:hypothetical protein
MTESSGVEMAGNAQVSAHDIDEGGVALGGPDGGHVADEPEDETRDPQPQSKSVPLTIATDRGAPPIRIGSVRAR